ncbi:YkgJ family cysteine cluster protein [Candidatus Sumerlaeota bacterium]|nr:YkgJ family cysteine cluster protein [Candidatus Sumerlaeota bacterium]
MLDPDQFAQFVCQRCGNCCAIDGYVYVKVKEQIRIADYLELTLKEFRLQYCEYVQGEGWVLIDQPESTKCIFLNDDRTCRVHPVKPDQCRNFLATWSNTNAEAYCEGLKLLIKQQDSDANAMK